MAEAPTIQWPGHSGEKYKYWIYPIGSNFKKEPGNYIFAQETSPQKWTPCYIGQTKNLDERLDDHNEEECAKRHGATHIHAHLTKGGEDMRRAEEQDLVMRWDPPCNDQHVDRG